MKDMIAKDIVRIGNRVLLEFLLLKQDPKVQVDLSMCFSVGFKFGLGLSMLAPGFLLEINVLPLARHTHRHYIDHG